MPHPSLFESDSNTNPGLPIAGPGVSAMPTILDQVKNHFDKQRALRKSFARLLEWKIFPDWFIESPNWLFVEAQTTNLLFIPSTPALDETIKKQWSLLNEHFRQHNVNIELIACKMHGVWKTTFEMCGIRFSILSCDSSVGFQPPVLKTNES